MERLEVSYSKFKTLASSLSVAYCQQSSGYVLAASSSGTSIVCYVIASEDVSDFEANLKPTATSVNSLDEAILTTSLSATTAYSTLIANIGAAAPSQTTPVGMTDGYNVQVPKLFDLDSGAGTDFNQGVSIRLPSSGGSVAGGTAEAPIRTDPTGTTTQPVSAASLPLPAGAAQDSTLTGGTQRSKITDGTNNAALSGSAPTGTEQGLIVRNIPSGTQTVSGTITAAQSAAANLNATVVGSGSAGTPASGVITVQGISGGTTIPVSTDSLPLPTGASTESTLSTLSGKFGSLGQKAMTGSAPVVIASDQSAIPISGSITATNASIGSNGTTAPTFSTLVGGSDGTNLRPLKVSSDGTLSIANASVGTNWAPMPASSTLLGCRATGGYVPAPDCYLEGGDNYGLNPIQSDSMGQLITRSVVYSDERSFRTDFPSTYFTTITGTSTFVNGSDQVVGIGTAFTTELNKDWYIKLSADGDDKYTPIADIIDDTHLTLGTLYSGSSTTGSVKKSRVILSVGTGGSISIANSLCSIASGTTSGSVSYIYRYADFGPLYMFSYAYLDQRRANQEFYLGLTDTLTFASAKSFAMIVFDGTDATVVKFKSSSDGEAIQTTTVSLPNGLTTANTSSQYEISVVADCCVLSIDHVEIARHKLHIPKPYDGMFIYSGYKNTGTPAGTSTLNVDTILVANHNRVEIANSFAGSPISIKIDEDIHTINGKLTTTSQAADQIIISYVVPAGKFAFASGYNVSSYSTTVNGSPLKIGKGSLTESVAPGAMDSEVFRSIYLTAKTNSLEQFSCPRYLAAGGETIKVAVTPDGTGNTIWRASLDIILR
jgi:hypothetical protein